MHKQILRSLITALLAASSFAAHADNLNITITNIPDSNGQLLIQVVAGEAGFKEQQPPVASLMIPAVEGSVTISTDALSPGDYAIRLFHDQNGNGEMDSNMVGIPKEPWGFSNSAVGSFGPPKWKKAKFTIQGDTQQNIELVH